MRTTFSILGLIALSALSRLVPHLPNMTALSGVALKSGARFGMWGVAIPLSGMLISDIVIGFYNWRLLISVYSSFALITLLGQYTQRRSYARVSTTAISGSLIFFFITNTVVWASSTWYSHTLSGLFTCYIAALPFLAPMIVGDILFSLLLCKNFAQSPFLKRARQTVVA